jgi:hypothetical protein
MTDGDWREELGEVCEGEESLDLTCLSEEKLVRVLLRKGSSSSEGGGDVL